MSPEYSIWLVRISRQSKPENWVLVSTMKCLPIPQCKLAKNNSWLRQCSRRAFPQVTTMNLALFPYSVSELEPTEVAFWKEFIKHCFLVGIPQRSSQRKYVKIVIICELRRIARLLLYISKIALAVGVCYIFKPHNVSRKFNSQMKPLSTPKIWRMLPIYCIIQIG